MAKKPTAWNIHVMKVYKVGKSKNSKYTFTDALKDAKRSYK